MNSFPIPRIIVSRPYQSITSTRRILFGSVLGLLGIGVYATLALVLTKITPDLPTYRNEEFSPPPLWKRAVATTYPDSLPLNGPLAPLLHDPGLCLVEGPAMSGHKRATTKLYTLAATGYGIPLRTSPDRTNWSDAGYVWPNDSTPTSTNQFTGKANGNLWAPDITHTNTGYWLYYSASSLGSQNSAIFLAWSATGASGDWEDRGVVVQSSSADDWNAIDPRVYFACAWWLAYGSYWSGIKLLPLNSTTGKPPSNAVQTSISRRPGTGAETAEEGAFLFNYGPYWYLFTSWGSCCDGSNSTYSIHVSRSSAITGPYVGQGGVQASDGGGGVILASHGNVVGPGGQSVILDTDGPLMVYHYSAEKPKTYHIGLNRLDFGSGWPVVI